MDVGIDIGSDKICILGYADDIVLLTETEAGLQLLLNTLNVMVSQ